MMIFMPAAELRAYFTRLRPYVQTSLAVFGLGIFVGLLIVWRFPEIAGQFHSSLVGFVKMFQGMPRLQLAGAIFFNNAVKTLVAIALGCLFGVIPGIFLLLNGVALGLLFWLSIQSRGLWISLLSIVPHGILELPAVFFGTSIGLMLGVHALKRVSGKTATSLSAELACGLKFFCTVILPLLFLAALIEAFFTAVLVTR